MMDGMSRLFGAAADLVFASEVRLAMAQLDAPSRFDGAILDVGLPDGSGLEVLAELRARGHDWPVLVLTDFFEKANAKTAQLHGAAFLPKPPEPAHLDAFLAKVEAYAEDVATREVAAVDRFAYANALTSRERQVLSLAMWNVPRAQVSSVLGVKRSTTKSHTRSLLEKAGADTLAEVVDRIRAELARDPRRGKPRG